MMIANSPIFRCAFVHFQDDILASVRYHGATIDGERVRISPWVVHGQPVHYAQRPLSVARSQPVPLVLPDREVDLFEDFSPSPSPSPSPSVSTVSPPPPPPPPPSSPPSPRQQQRLSSLQQQQQHHAFNGMIRKNLQEIDGMVLAYREEIEKLLERRQRLEELLLQ